MSTSATKRNPAAKRQPGVAEEATKHVMDAILHGLNAMMLVPHMLMQANLQAALWTGIENLSVVSGAAGSGAREFVPSKSS